MSSPSDNETWLIERGDAVIEKKARVGMEGLTPWETIVYCLWVADFEMRNAGDLDTAGELYAEFQADARRFAADLALPLTHGAFALPKGDLERQYFERFEAICDEIGKSAGQFDVDGA